MNAFIAFLKGKKKIFTLMKIAKHVIVCTDYLENEARKHNQNVTNISSTFDTERFTPLKSYKQTDEIALGWTGSHSTMAFLHLLDNVLIEVAKKRKVKLISICDRDFELEGIKIENIRWTGINEVSDLHKFQIGLYPTPKEDWVLGKSGLKALTYQSCAIPLVATAFGSNLRNIDNEINGFLADSDKEWVDAIIKLIDSEELREKIGKNGRDNVVKRFSLDANKKTYLEILNRVVKQKKSA